MGHEAVSCISKSPTPNEKGEKEKNEESAVMAVDQEPDFEATAETKHDEIDGGHMACCMTVEIENNVPQVAELPPESTVES